MKGIMTNRWLGAALRIIIGVWFISYSMGKLVDPQGFADSISNYHLVPNPLVNTLAIVLPWIEFVAGICLVAGIFSRGASLIVICLLAAFIGAIISAIARDLNISCGCKGEGSHKVGWVLVMVDTLGLIAAIQIYLSSRLYDPPVSCIIRRRG